MPEPYDHIPRIPLPTTAQFNTTIDVFENGPNTLRGLAQPIAWLRDRLDPLHALEQAEEERVKDVEAGGEDMDKKWAEMSREFRRENRRMAIVPTTAGQAERATSSKTTRREGRKEMPGRNKDMDDNDSDDGPVVDQSWDIMNRTFLHKNLGPDKQPPPGPRERIRISKPTPQNQTVGYLESTFEDKSRSREQEETRKPERKTAYPPAQKPDLAEARYLEKPHSRSQEKQKVLEANRKSFKAPALSQEKSVEPMATTHPKQKFSQAQGQSEPELSLAIPDSPPVKIRLHPAERERVARELKEALSTNQFKVWPLESSPYLEDAAKKPDESTEFRAPLSREEQAKKQQLMDQWMMKQERDIKGRRRFQGKGGYEDEVEKQVLKSTDWFQPTLAPYVGTGLKIPTREEVRDEYEAESEYEDAMEYLPRTSRYWNKPEVKGKTREGQDKESQSSKGEAKIQNMQVATGHRPKEKDRKDKPAIQDRRDVSKGRPQASKDENRKESQKTKKPTAVTSIASGESKSKAHEKQDISDMKSTKPPISHRAKS
ncbi:uncharacterized protein LY89DRAFT_337063 [Mollisia scopiformis]|uniref:Uncharacterized protein n=1 Tax=Mollisia scopiformis TaxID=149040 RepID=A0A132B6Y4_MOLSC|nr:uncharacterized protein LY89DRAFT_337063 [Mollisia scopiformis]KUJ08172.1 hypothetical protein LY89DRAFT_337063 [Mollisia scopiformis]